jgi:hypothetical protein
MAKRKDRAASQYVEGDVQFLDLDAPPTPETEPAFVNSVRFTRLGTDVFLDAGVIPIDDVIKVQSKDRQTARIVVTHRLAMSVNTFATLCEQANAILSSMRGEVLLHESLLRETGTPNETQRRPRQTKKRNPSRG